ncbi:MAG: hypothetical protein FWE06_07065 [Oscillospiraceae bacterium]|nr:hypothetical protein [Oscillospiraceae bacterium]
MKLELTDKQFRRLLDLAYVGNWIINSTRDANDRIVEFDEVESLLFEQCAAVDMPTLVEKFRRQSIPSQQFCEGGIHEVILDYENVVFFEILAEELARRDMQAAALDEEDIEELSRRISDYILEFERNGTDNIVLDK